MEAYFQDREIVAIGTARQGASLDVIYEGRMRPSAKMNDLVTVMNRVEGVQSVELHRRDFDRV